MLRAEGAEAKTDQNPRAVEALVPSAPGPAALELCRYYGFGFRQTPQTQARKGKLRSERILSKVTAVRSIAGEFDALPEFPEGPIACPDDEGARLYAIFSYADEPNVPVEVSLSGCRSAANGRTGPAYSMASPLLKRLTALTAAG